MCADTFTAMWVTRFDVPALLTSDQGCQFVSSLWGHLCEQLGVQRQLTTAYHLQANGMPCLPGWLAHSGRSTFRGSSWAYMRPPRRILASPRQSSCKANRSPFLASLSPPRSPTFNSSCARCQVQPLPTRPLPSMLPAAPPKALESAQLVYVRRSDAAAPLSLQYQGPYKVVEREPNFFRLCFDNRVEPVSVDCLKTHLRAAPTPPAFPPSRSRPPAARDLRTYVQVVTGGALWRLQTWLRTHQHLPGKSANETCTYICSRICLTSPVFTFAKYTPTAYLHVILHTPINSYTYLTSRG